MKYVLILCSFLFCATAVKAQEINFGIGGSLASKGPAFGVQARGAYGLTDRFKLSAAYTYYIKDNTNYAIDADARFTLLRIEEYAISPLVGIDLSRIESVTAVGLNLGLFLRIDRDRVDIYLEPKFVLDTESYFVISGGLYF